MGADTCHLSTKMQPSKYNPLPSAISPHPSLRDNVVPCPGALLKSDLGNEDAKKPFYGTARPGLVPSNPDTVQETVDKVIEADGSGNTFVVTAHDSRLKGAVRRFRNMRMTCQRKVGLRGADGGLEGFQGRG